MNMDTARRMLDDAKKAGLRLHGISSNGKPAISFDDNQPGAELARRRFQATQGLMREQLRAAMIIECQQHDLPQDLKHHSMDFDLGELHTAPASACMH